MIPPEVKQISLPPAQERTKRRLIRCLLPDRAASKARAVTRVFICAVLAFGLGCAKTDWIDRTLVTVDVTGTWLGSFGGAGPALRDVVFELEQKGSTVTGGMRVTPGFGTTPSPIDGSVAGDVFRFRDSRGNLEGELTVSGDEMDGRTSFFGSSSRMSLRRADSSSRPGSQRR
jgi:hypothetical protein